MRKLDPEILPMFTYDGMITEDGLHKDAKQAGRDSMRSTACSKFSELRNEAPFNNHPLSDRPHVDPE